LALLPRAYDRQSRLEALQWVDAACRQGVPEAYIVLAVLFILGIGVKRDLAQAHVFLKQAAGLGSARAKAQLEIFGPDKIDEAWQGELRRVQHFDAPRVQSIEQLIPKAAAIWLIELARPRLQRSTVYGAGGAGSADDEGRTSSQAGFNLLEPDVVLALVNLRIAEAMDAVLTNFEYATVLHYAVGQEYKLHFDIKVGENADAYASELQQFGQRAGTALIYLNDDYAGGETEFPKLDWRFKGKAGDALLFWSLSEQGAPELGSCHAGLNVESGEKWLLSKWLREKPFPWG
jgi:prolyl 4-hydroxylase